MLFDLKRVGHAEEKEKKEAKAIRPRVWEQRAKQRAEAQGVFRPFLCEFQSEQVTQKRELQLRGAVRKIERNTVRVRE